MLQFAWDHICAPNRVTRVELDGVDVSKDCYAFNEQTGYVGLIVRGADGRAVRDEYRNSKKTFRRGKVKAFRDPHARSMPRYLTVATLRAALDTVPDEHKHRPIRITTSHQNIFAVDVRSFPFVLLIP